jgi:hypothetical protein
VTFATSSIVDPVGKVFFHDGRVFRAIYSEEAAKFCLEILDSPWINEAFDSGLVKTWVPSDVSLQDARVVLEHERIPFTVVSAEFTSRMHWEGAKTLVRVASVLSRHGIFLKDAHPWNILFHKGRPIFVDFGSLQATEAPRLGWVDQYRQYFAVPLWLASRWMTAFAREYRRQHSNGFGLKLFDSRFLKWPFLLSLAGLRPDALDAEQFFGRLDSWLDAHKPRTAGKERWATYPQSGGAEDPLRPSTVKQRFVHDVLTSSRPRTVLDCAANKGYYSEMAAHLGAVVAAFDYEEYCVDACLSIATEKSLDITPAIMDFKFPTPPFGWGLTCASAFDRFQSEIVLALGLVHHLCLAQRVPVRLFCEMCLAYSSTGIVLEYVDPTDMHVATWKMTPPADYSVEGFSRYLSTKYPHRNVVTWTSAEGINRTLLFFHR